jgi:hypothetical protein
VALHRNRRRQRNDCAMAGGSCWAHGQVPATHLDTRYLEHLEGRSPEVHRHDIGADPRLQEDNGVNRRYGCLLAGPLRRCGLNSVGAEAQMFMWQQDSSGIPMMRVNFEQLREAMIIDGNYVTQQQFDEDLARLDDPDFMTPSAILWPVWGQRI